MNKFRFILSTLIFLVLMTVLSGTVMAADGTDSVVDVQKYNRSIHIMAMLLVGFGFLMVFVKKYGRSALTATFLMVSLSIPLYFCIHARGFFGGEESLIDTLILAEFAAASLLICAGAVLGRLKMYQYLIMGLLFIPCYMFNEWLILSEGMGLLAKGTFADTGGSIVIHAFGALFGFGLILTMTTKKEFDTPIEADENSDRFSMLGSMVLWLFWPSFCAALVPVADIPKTIINVILALCGATLATYFTTVALRRKIAIADIANASLAGGVAIGSTCDFATPLSAMFIGILAGVLSVIGFAVILPRLQEKIKKTDTCGVMYLHGLPGLMGGLAAMFVVDGLSTSAQLTGVGITVGVALVTGYLSGLVISMFGRRVTAYVDSEEFSDAE
ncbi:MAG: ammonium transporter [bacterium]|nr:ammonium transporter [bacterium]